LFVAAASARPSSSHLSSSSSTACSRCQFRCSSSAIRSPAARVRCAAGLGKVDLYTATRHYFGWYALNVLDLPPHVIALHFGHRDGGKLVRMNYGHPDAKIARERVREAFRRAPAAPIPLVAAGR
jgi:hypothetical protein